MVAAALQILASNGYQGMRFEDVAERADIAKATLYHYFPSKDALVAAALEALTEDVLERLNVALAETSGGSARDQLTGLVAQQLDVLTISYPEVGKLFSYPGQWPVEHTESIKTMRRRHDLIFRDVVDRGIDAREFDCPDPDVALHCLHGILNHASIWLRPEADEDGRTRTAVIDQVLRLFVRS